MALIKELQEAAERQAEEDEAHLEELREKARRAVGTPQGQQELLGDIREGLITAMYLEKEAGEQPKDAGKSTEANARQSRKQFKELAELVMEMLEEDI